MKTPIIMKGIKVMQYESRPHTVDAFKFTDSCVKPPQWFVEAIHEGRASVTINSKDRYITLFNTKGDIERAYVGHWICKNTAGKLFRITDDEFKTSYSL